MWTYDELKTIQTRLSSFHPDLPEYQYLLDFATDMAEQDCHYNDNCPAFGTNHYQCDGCRARKVLDKVLCLMAEKNNKTG